MDFEFRKKVFKKLGYFYYDCEVKEKPYIGLIFKKEKNKFFNLGFVRKQDDSYIVDIGLDESGPDTIKISGIYDKEIKVEFSYKDDKNSETKVKVLKKELFR